MKLQLKLVLFTMAIVLCRLSYAQQTVDQLMKIRPISIVEHPTNNEENVIFLPMEFSSSKFVKPPKKVIIPEGKEVITVHLVYTKYRQIDTFNQPMLNRKRFENLQALFPEVFDMKQVEWRVLEQRKAKTEAEARKMYHGFVIFLREPPSEEKLSAEKWLINRILLNFHDSIIDVPEKTLYRKRKRRVETGLYIPRNERKAARGIRYNRPGIWFREPEMTTVIDSIPRKKIKGYKKRVGVFNGGILANTNEFDALLAKKMTGKWVVVTDVTASMAPYSAQVLAYIKFNEDLRKNGHFSFFNDGNGAPHMLKRIGASGGIYTCKYHEFDSIYNTLVTAMQNGDGGDIPENNIEAILTSLQKWPDSDSVLMIADAKAPIKDMMLLKFVKKPVSVVLCGNVNGDIPNDYLTLVKTTGGTIIQTDDEIRDIKKLKVGDTFDCGDRVYKLTDKGIIRTE